MIIEEDSDNIVVEPDYSNEDSFFENNEFYEDP